MSLSWVFHAELPRVPPAHKLHATFFLWTSLYITELILSCYRKVSGSFPIQALFSHLTCGWLVLPFVPVVPPEYQICVPSFWEVREGLWPWGDTSHPDWFNLWCSEIDLGQVVLFPFSQQKVPTMSLFCWDHWEVLGVLAWNSAGQKRASKAAAKMKALMGLIAVHLVHCVTRDFQSTFSSMLGSLPVGQYYSINKGADRKE